MSDTPRRKPATRRPAGAPGHKTESVYRRYSIVSESDLAEAARQLDSVAGTVSGTIGPKSGESS